MDSKLKRAKAPARETSAIGRTVARPRAKRTVPRPEPEALSFTLADALRTRATVVFKGVVVKPPRPPRAVIQVTFEVPIEAPEC